MRRTKIAGLVAAFVILLSLGVVTKFVLFRETKAEIEAKLETIQRRIITETEFGKEMAHFIRSQKTKYILDQTIPGEARYQIIDDRIHYRPISLKVQKEWLLKGKPAKLMQRFHEEIHRAQHRLSKWKPFVDFFRKHGGIRQIEGMGKPKLMFSFEGSAWDLAAFLSEDLREHLEMDTDIHKLVAGYIDSFTVSLEKTWILREVQAYLSCEIPAIEGLHYKLRSDMIFDMPERDFREIYKNVYELYGYYEGDHARVSEFIGNSGSLNDFSQRLCDLLKGVDEAEIGEKAQVFADKKWAFYRAVAKIAEEHF